MPAREVRINLLADNAPDTSPVGRLLEWATTYGRYIMIGTEIVVLLAFISRFSLDRKITDLKEEIEQKQLVIEANVDFENEFRHIQKRVEHIASLWTNQKTPLEIIATLTKILPPDLILSSLQFQSNTLTVSAQAGTNSGFSQFLSNLQSLPTFTDIKFQSIHRDPIKGIEFTFIATLQ